MTLWFHADESSCACVDHNTTCWFYNDQCFCRHGDDQMCLSVTSQAPAKCPIKAAEQASVRDVYSILKVKN